MISQVFSSNEGLKQAVAYETLAHLLYDTAVEQGTVVSEQDARSYAQQAYNSYVSSFEHPSQHTPHVLPPTNDEFFSAFAIAQYQFNLTVSAEMAKITGSSSSASMASPHVARPRRADRTSALQQWMQGVMAAHVVTLRGVSGIDDSNIPSHLPDTV